MTINHAGHVKIHSSCQVLLLSKIQIEEEEVVEEELWRDGVGDTIGYENSDDKNVDDGGFG